MNVKIRQYSCLICLLIFGLVFAGMVVSAATIKVPEDYSTIQAAVDNANAGDVIEVAAYTYPENHITVNKSLSFVGEDKANTILDVEGNQYGFYSTTDSVTISGFKVINFTSHAVNFQDGSSSTISNNVFDPGGSAISAVQAFSSVSGVEVGNNEMYGVGVAAYMGSCDNWTTSHNLIDIEKNPHMGIVGGGSNYVIEYNDIINSGSRSDEGNHQAIDTYQFGNPSDWKIQYNNIYGNEDGIQIEGTGHEVHYNSIHDNTFIGLTCDSQIDATLNWWGSSDGPWYDEDRDGVPEYDGGGDKIYGTTYFSPWLGIEPDTDPNTVGVQLKSPMTFVVDDIGPPPDVGYVNTAISASNDQINFPGSDTIQVKEGTYNPSQPITDSTTLISESGPVSDFILNAELSIESPGVILGSPGHGFTVKDDIVIEAGVTGYGKVATVRRNNLEGTLNHSGNGTVDALFNYWNGTRPETKTIGNSSEVIFSPWLGELPGTSPMTYVVDDVGNKPAGGYLNTALATATEKDTIEVLTDEGQDDYEDVTGMMITEDITVPAEESGSGLTLNHNVITGLLTHNGSGTVDASVNYWGDNEPEDNLAGDKSSIIYSPWLRTPPGYSPTVYMVDDVGAKPEGSLQRAISDANTHGDRDKIVVNDGDYMVSADKPVTQSTEIVSTTGCPANACINGELTLEAEQILLGKREELTNQGFTINADIRVASGVDASTIHINWNDIYGTVTNDGVGRLNAQFNWWGDTEPEDSIVGDVDYEPYLPTDVCSFLAYMKENDIDDPVEAINEIHVSSVGDASSSQQAVAQLISRGFSLSEAEDLLNDLGLGRVNTALNGAKDSGHLVELLGGYRLPAGASGGLTNNVVVGGAGSVGGKTVGAVFQKGEIITVTFPLADFEGEPVIDLHPTVSLILLDENGQPESLVRITTASYDEVNKAYVATFSTVGLEPGYYKVRIDLPDGSSLSRVVKVEV